MSFIDNLRQWTSEQFDKMTDQQNTYHRSSGKTQKEFGNDIETYKALEKGILVDALLSSAGVGAGLGAGLLGIAGSTVVLGIAGMEVVKSTAPLLPAGTAAILGSVAGGSLGGGFAGAEKQWDNKENGGTDFESVKPVDKSDMEPESSDEEDDDDDDKEEETEEMKSPEYDMDEMAGEFILGAWGNGQDRIDNMINAGYSLDDYNKIQQRVNDAYASGRDLHEWTNNAAHKLGYW